MPEENGRSNDTSKRESEVSEKGQVVLKRFPWKRWVFQLAVVGVRIAIKWWRLHEGDDSLDR